MTNISFLPPENRLKLTCIYKFFSSSAPHDFHLANTNLHVFYLYFFFVKVLAKWEDTLYYIFSLIKHLHIMLKHII